MVDTPPEILDWMHGRPHDGGAKTVAVATGVHSAAAHAALGADAVLENLADPLSLR